MNLLAKLTLIISLAFYGASTISAQDADYRTATSLIQQGQITQALALLRRMAAQRPTDPQVHNLLGIALTTAGKMQEANEEFKRALALNPKLFSVLKNLALNELALGQLEDAKRHFESLLTLSPHDRACHWGLAEIAFAKRDFAQAALHYERSGDLAWKEPTTLLKFASSYTETGQRDRALALLEKLPADIDAKLQFEAGLLFAKLGKFDLSARRFAAARSDFPDQYRVGYNLAFAQLKAGEFATAIGTIEELLAKGYRQAELYNLLAQAYEASGRTNEAYEALRLATASNPTDEANYLDLIMLCLKHQSYDLGLKIADIGLRHLPNSYRLRLHRGAVWALKGEYEEAMQDFEIASRLAPDNGLPAVARGMVLIQMGKAAEAVELLRRQSVKSPNDPLVFWFLGEALDYSGPAPGSAEEKEAIGALERAIELDADLPQPRALLGKLLLRRGETAKAVEELERAFKLAPDDPTTTYLLAQALQKSGEAERAKQLFAKVSRARTRELETTRLNLIRVINSEMRSNRVER